MKGKTYQQKLNRQILTIFKVKLKKIKLGWIADPEDYKETKRKIKE